MQEETDSKNVVKKCIISIFQKKIQEINIYFFFLLFYLRLKNKELKTVKGLII